jgi:hypothetical protein
VDRDATCRVLSPVAFCRFNKCNDALSGLYTVIPKGAELHLKGWIILHTLGCNTAPVSWGVKKYTLQTRVTRYALWVPSHTRRLRCNATPQKVFNYTPKFSCRPSARASLLQQLESSTNQLKTHTRRALRYMLTSKYNTI